MEDCCDICGVIGVADALITCTQCKINCEHMYCMRTLLEEHIDDWRCEECESSSKPKPLASCLLGELPDVPKLSNSVEGRNGSELCSESRKLLNDSRGGSHDWERMVATGKTKYICVKEAIMLSSVEKKPFAPSNITCHSKPTRPKIGVNKSERTLIRPKTVPLLFSSQQNLASGPLRQPKPQRLGNMEISERQWQQSKKLTEVQRSVSSLQPSQAPMNKHMQKEQPAEVQLPQTKARRLMKTPLSGPSPNASPVTISGGIGHTTIELRTCNAENGNNNLLPDLEKCSRAPALDALWKGSFSIQDNHRHWELNHQIQAHPPSQVRGKICEFSKQMPEVLHFQLVPFKKFWINLFEYIPDERDIGLYFFPSVGERSEDYISLLESISVRNLALRKQIADVELLVFTSKLLRVNCQCWEGKNFLWGVFHHLKRDTTARVDNRGLKLSVQPLHDANPGHNQVDDREEADMDIDMIGGINVGRKDVPVQKETLRGKCISFRKESVTAMSLPGSDKQINYVSRHIFDPATTVPSLNIKMEPHDAVPPGFEEVCRLRVQGSSSSVENVGVGEGKRREPDYHGCLRSFPAKLKSEYV
ncbi:hypothetical protein Pfo_011387 [Paulownia fortunei]|nr:hypothetical protein Pfo_011387 [Paulownia fortunei]